jgi:hypothetical protein
MIAAFDLHMEWENQAWVDGANSCTLQAKSHRLNMKLDLQSLFGLLCIQLHLLSETPQPPPPPLAPRIWVHIRGRY